MLRVEEKRENESESIPEELIAEFFFWIEMKLLWKAKPQAILIKDRKNQS